MAENNLKNTKIRGYVDVCDQNRISGWIADLNQLQKSLQIRILIDNVEYCNINANNYREDLNKILDGTNHAFKVEFPNSIHDGKEHEIKVIELGTGFLLGKSPSKVKFPEPKIKLPIAVNANSIPKKINKPFLFGVPPAIERSPFLTTEENFRSVGQNTGNLAFSYAINQMLGGNLNSINWWDSLSSINELGNIGILTLANQLGPHLNMGSLAKTFNSLQCKLVGIGLGAQATNLQQNVNVPQGTLDWIKVIQDHSISSAPNIAMRGEFSWKVLEKYKLADKAAVLSCPTLFISPDRQLGQTIVSNFKETPKLIAVAGGHQNWSNFSKIENSLAQIADAYICQSSLEMIQLGRGETQLLSTELRNKCRKYINPQLTDDEFINWCNKNAMSFFSASAWMEYLKRFDFVIGTRIHGVMLALQVGVPALCIAHDSRTQEFCETAKIPYIEAKNVLEGIRREDIPHLFSFDPVEFDKNRRILAEGYLNFLISNGLLPDDYLKQLTIELPIETIIRPSNNTEKLNSQISSVEATNKIFKMTRSSHYVVIAKWIKSLIYKN